MRTPLPKAQAEADSEAQRQRRLDEAMADVAEIVGRHRARMGRKVCSPEDGALMRQLFAALVTMPGTDVSADKDPSWRGHGG